MPTTPNYEFEEVEALLPKVAPKRTLRKARCRYARVLAGKGGPCPTCRRSGKVNPHNLTSHLVRILIWMLEQTGPARKKWINMPETTPAWIKGSNQYSKLAYWGFVKKRGDRGEKTKHSGYWKPTKTGRRFITQLKRVPLSAFVYDKEVVGFSVEQVRCEEVRGFDYWEQIKGTWMEEKAKRWRRKHG